MAQTPTLEEVVPFVPGAPPAIPKTENTVTYNAPAPAPVSTPTETPVYKPPEEYKPTGDATVEGRMTGLLSKGSPYVEQARQSGVTTAQKRGLLNSTMAASAGEKAAIESALPIATQDANATNTAGMAGYTGKLDAAKSTQTYEQQKGLVGVQAEASSKLQSQAARETAAIETMKADIASGLSVQEATQKAYQTSYEASIAAGLSEQQAKQQAALESQKAASQYALQERQLGSEEARAAAEIEARKYLSAEQIAAQKALSTDQIIANRDNLQAELLSRDTINSKTIAGQKAIADLDASVREKLSAADIAARKEMSTAEIQARVDLLNQEYQNKIGPNGLIAAQTAADKTLEDIRQAGATERANAVNAIETSKLSAAEKESAGQLITNLGTTYAEQVANVQRDPNVPTASKKTVISGLTTAYRNSLMIIGATTGVEIQWESAGVTPATDTETAALPPAMPEWTPLPSRAFTPPGWKNSITGEITYTNPFG
jgi:hypothetical protein